jgi:hypothetical protein
MSLEDRVARLERENRRWKLLGAVALLGLAAIFLMGQARGPQTVEAENFIVRDRDGVRRAILGASYPVGGDETSAGLAFYTALPDGQLSQSTFFQVGPGQEAVLQLASDRGVVSLRSGAADAGPRISVIDRQGGRGFVAP